MYRLRHRFVRALGFFPLAVLGAVLGACVSAPPIKVTQDWQHRVNELTSIATWHAQGRAAAKVDDQGWQASLDWQQTGSDAVVRLAGPLGVGAVTLRLTAAGIVLDRPGPSGSTDADQLIRERMGFTPPFEDLRYWLLGVPAPSGAASLDRNPQDRAARIVQDDWSIDYTRYMNAGVDLLPAQMTLQHGNVRVRIVVDHWDLGPGA
jgi:outer membrane lipoprotein LolB